VWCLDLSGSQAVFIEYVFGITMDKEWVEMFGDCEAMPELSDADIMQQAREARANTPAHVLSSMCLV
jgi:hypothetical protein